MSSNPLGELLRDAANWIDENAYSDLATFDGSLSIDEVVANGEWHCVGCGVHRASEPAHESTCPVAKLVERLRFAEVELGKAAEAFASVEPELRKIVDEVRADGTHESRPGVALATPGARRLRFRLLLDPETRRAKVEPGDEATAAWLASNRDVFLAEQERSLRGLDLRGELTEEVAGRLERALIDVVRALDPLAAPVVERYRPAKPPTSP